MRQDYIIDRKGNMIHRLANIASDYVSFGTNCRVDAFVTITGNVRIGDDVHIGAGVAIFGTHGVFIGNGVSLSPGSKIFTATDDPSLEMVTNPQLDDRCGQIGQVSIGDYSSIGSNAVVLPGVTIEDEVQVGALSLVKTSLRRNGVYAGVPAKYIKERAGLIYGHYSSKS